MSLERRKSLRNSLKRKSDSSQVMGAYKRKSLLLQHSRSLNIPIDELSQYSGLNWFLNIPDQVFSLTYLSENDTQNPESLEMLEDLKFGTWHTYLAGLLYNFSYQPAQRNSLEKAITSGLRARFQNSKVEMTYRTRVSRHKALSPTENDSEALNITVIGKTAAKEQVLYVGFLVSWCSTIKEQHPFLPVLFCRGNNTYRDLINNIISEKFDVVITRFVFTEEELRYLTTYCLLMLSENDGLYVTFTYRLQTGDTIDLGMSVEPLLKLWSKIRHDDGIDIDSDEVMLYHEALDLFYESTFGIKFGFASFQGIKVNKCFSIQANSQMWFKSRKVITVVLKYLTHLAIKKLQVKKLSTYLDEGNVDPDSSVVSH